MDGGLHLHILVLSNEFYQSINPCYVCKMKIMLITLWNRLKFFKNIDNLIHLGNNMKVVFVSLAESKAGTKEHEQTTNFNFQFQIFISSIGKTTDTKNN